MPRDIRPWYRPHINGFYVTIILIVCAALWGGIEIVRRGYYQGMYLLAVGALLICAAAKGLWNGRNPWIYETHKGRKVTVNQYFRDEYDVCVGTRCARIYAEMVVGGVALSYDSIRNWRSSPMTEREREDVLDILLEEFEFQNAKVYLSGQNLPDSPHVKATQARIERELLNEVTAA